MNLSGLQKYILLQGLESRRKSVDKKTLLDYYSHRKDSPPADDQLSIITKSVDRLISRGLAKGAGIKTAEKWYVREVILTSLGKKTARRLLGEQQKLPLKTKIK